MYGFSVAERVAHPALKARKTHLTAASLAVALLLIVIGPPASAGSSGRNGQVKQRFLVVLQGSASARDVAMEHERRHGADVDLIYEHALRGYAAKLPPEAVGGIARDPRVASIEPDAPVRATSQTTPTGIRRVLAPANATLSIDGVDDVRVDVDIAILDTGLDAKHPDLNVASVADCTLASMLGSCSSGEGKDEHGHGTHVAGTAAALDNGVGVVGVAPGARLHGIKVLSAAGTGLMSWVVAGIDWVSARADIIEVANMSLGCDCPSEALDEALAHSVDRGVVYTVSAGNNGKDAQPYSPANHPDVITVSAVADFDGAPGGKASATCGTNRDDTLAAFSNRGPAIEVAAPGDCILSTAPAGRYQTMSGTSMASPHVAGAAAILTSGANDPRDRAEVALVRDRIIGLGSFDWLDTSGDGIQEPLLDVSRADVFVANSAERTLEPPPAAPEGAPGENQPPVARFTFSCAGLVCDFDAGASSDPDGTISSYSWDFGDATTGAGANVQKTYGSSGSYTVTLEVVDDSGAASRTSHTISATEETSETADIRLSGTGTRLYGRATVDLRWEGTDRHGLVTLYRNGVALGVTEDDGAYTETYSQSSGSVTYVICEDDTQRCSNQLTLFS